MNKKLFSSLVILAVLSFSILVFGLIFQHELPKLVDEINSGALGVIFAAIVTVMLLKGQSESDLKKEINVKIFETKSEKYEEFIDKVWDVWSDRVITDFEFADMIRMFSKNILLYAKESTVKSVLNSFENIQNNLPNKNTDILQKEIFNIINILALDLEINEARDNNANIEISKKLNDLEKQLIPAIEEKRKNDEINIFKSKFINGLSEFFKSESVEYTIDKFTFNLEKNEIGFNINHTNLRFNIIKEKNNNNWNFWISLPRGRTAFDAYRVAQLFSGKKLGNQLLVKNTSGKITFDMDFNDVEKIRLYFSEFQETDYFEENKLGKSITDILENIRMEGKTIQEVIDESENKK